MRPESLKLFAKLMENGYITREQSPAYYEYYNDPEIASELAIMEQELDFTLYKTNGRLYLLPDPNNELFSQDNNDFRRSVGNEKLEELYLLNYMAIFLLHELYGGKETHCKQDITSKNQIFFPSSQSIVSRYALKENP